jgi:hypothetical protein
MLNVLTALVMAGSAGSSFLTAAPIAPEQPAQVAAVTGDYLYWSFTADAGQQPELTAKVTLPASADRSGPESWIVEVFDGLRRRQPCVAGDQSPVAAADATEVTLGCKLRQVRSWAEPSDQDPLPRHVFCAALLDRAAGQGPGPAGAGRAVAGRPDRRHRRRPGQTLGAADPDQPPGRGGERRARTGGLGGSGSGTGTG